MAVRACPDASSIPLSPLAAGCALQIDHFPLDRLRHTPQQVDELDLGHVERLHFDVGNDARLQAFELLALGVGDAHAGLLLARKRFDLLLKFRHGAASESAEEH